MDRSIIEKYVAGGPQLQEAYAGLTKSELFAVPIPNTWSLHQIAIHMMDSDFIGSDRMKRIACMEKPLLIGYDETGFNNLPGVESIDTFEAIEMFAKNRVFTGKILSQLPDESFKRYGIHSEKGKVTLEEMVSNYIQHLEGHLEWISKKRQMVRKG